MAGSQEAPQSAELLIGIPDVVNVIAIFLQSIVMQSLWRRNGFAASRVGHPFAQIRAVRFDADGEYEGRGMRAAQFANDLVRHGRIGKVDTVAPGVLRKIIFGHELSETDLLEGLVAVPEGSAVAMDGDG